MSNSLFELGQMVLALLVFGYIFYTLAFSGKEAARREAQNRARHGFERREVERVERRQKNQGPPDGHAERRKVGGRRGVDA